MAAVLPVGVSQAQLLLALAQEGPQRVADLARDAGISGPSMTVMAERLGRAGWIERRPDPSDGRAVLLVITAAGREMLDSVATARTRLLARRLAALDPQDLSAIALALPALGRLEQAWHGAPGQAADSPE
jgi:DNA-binding MarR family transcriptional regulator